MRPMGENCKKYKWCIIFKIVQKCQWLNIFKKAYFWVIFNAKNRWIIFKTGLLSNPANLLGLWYIYHVVDQLVKSPKLFTLEYSNQFN